MSVSFRMAPVRQVGDTFEEHPFGKGPRDFVLADQTIKEMVTAANQTRRDGKERGFNFCIDPSRAVRGVSKKFAILKSAGRCIGSACALEITKECPDEEIETDMFQFISPGQKYGDYHTHPYPSTDPSVTDKLNSLSDGVLYKRNVLQCITGVSGAKGAEEWTGVIPLEDNPEKGDFDPVGCFVTPKQNLPDVDEYMAMITEYNEKVQPYYDEWSKTGEIPDGSDPKWEESVAVSLGIQYFLDNLEASVKFRSLDDLTKAKGWKQKAGPGRTRNYFAVEKVEVYTKKQTYEPGFKPWQPPPTLRRVFLSHCMSGPARGGRSLTSKECSDEWSEMIDRGMTWDTDSKGWVKATEPSRRTGWLAYA